MIQIAASFLHNGTEYTVTELSNKFHATTSIVTDGNCSTWTTLILPANLKIEFRFASMFTSQRAESSVIYTADQSIPSTWIDFTASANSWRQDYLVLNYPQNKLDGKGYSYTNINGVLYRHKNNEAKILKGLSSGALAIDKVTDINGVEYSCREIAEYAFEGNYSITAIEIKSSNLKIGDNAFKNCKNLKTVNYTATTQTEYYIGKNAFHGCVSLAKLKLPNGLKSIGDFAFAECISLGTSTVIADNTIVINDGLEYLGKMAFVNCANLKGVSLSANTVKARSYVFAKILSSDFKIHIRGAAAIPDSWHIYFNIQNASVIFE